MVVPDDLRSHYHDDALYEYSFHVSLEPKFVYVNNAKCGCTTAKASLNLWYAARHGLDLKLGSKAEIHDRKNNPLLAPRQLGAGAEEIILHDPAFFRLTLLREPLSRVASAHADKMNWNSPQRQRFNLAAGRPAEAEVPFSLFLSLIRENRGLRDMDEHWCLQSRQIAFDLIKYDRICLQENLTDELLEIRDKLFPGVTLGVYDTPNRSSSSKLLAKMSADDVAIVRDVYAEDFELHDLITAKRVNAKKEVSG